MFRFSDYNLISEKDVQDCGDFIRIQLPRSKQDQYYAGSVSFIAESG